MKRKTVLTVMVSGLLLGATALRADDLRIQNVSAAPRDGKTAIVTFDIAWSNSWRHGSFHDAAWVFFKVQADDRSGWQPVRLVADKVVNPAGYAQAEGGTPLEFVVPAGDDGFVGLFVRRAADGKGAVAAPSCGTTKRRLLATGCACRWPSCRHRREARVGRGASASRPARHRGWRLRGEAQGRH